MGYGMHRRTLLVGTETGTGSLASDYERMTGHLKVSFNF